MSTETQRGDAPPEPPARDLLTRIDGIGPDTANKLLAHFGSGRKVAQAACRYWGELVEVDGITEEKAREMFDQMLEADVFHDLRGY